MTFSQRPCSVQLVSVMTSNTHQKESLAPIENRMPQVLLPLVSQGHNSQESLSKQTQQHYIVPETLQMVQYSPPQGYTPCTHR